MGDVIEFFLRDAVEVFAPRLQLFVDLYGLFGHLLVGVFRASHQGEIRSACNAFVAVGIEPDSQQH